MRKLFLFVILTILSLFVGKAQVPTAVQTQSKVDLQNFKPLTKALLWRISGKGLTNTSYLYGTIHMIDKASFFMDKETEEAIKESQEIVFEIDLEEEMNPMAMLSLMPKMMMKGKTLKDLLDEADYKLVLSKLAETGLPSFLVEKMKPMFVSVMLETPPGGATEENIEMVSYEMHIMELAKKQNKPMDGLETATYQMSMFDSIPLETQAQMLISSIRDTTDTNSADGLAKIYLERDINKMVDMMGEMEESGDDSFTEFLLKGRNRNWIPVMEGKMKKGTTFFAVGAGHLGASFGVINLLRLAGYTVEPIK